jgi:hypothetical protein
VTLAGRAPRRDVEEALGAAQRRADELELQLGRAPRPRSPGKPARGRSARRGLSRPAAPRREASRTADERAHEVTRAGDEAERERAARAAVEAELEAARAAAAASGAQDTSYAIPRTS